MEGARSSEITAEIHAQGAHKKRPSRLEIGGKLKCGLCECRYLKYLEIKEIPFSLGLAEKTYQSLSSEKKGHIQ
jgi:hypothetical protein